MRGKNTIHPTALRNLVLALAVSLPSGLARAAWTSIPDPHRRPYALDFLDGRNGFAAGQRGILLRTIDGGSTWTDMAVPADETFGGVDFVHPDTGWIWGDSTLYKTEDGGATWTLQLEKRRMSYPRLRFLDGRNAFHGPSYATLDGGRTWRTRSASPPMVIADFDYATPARGFVVAVVDTTRWPWLQELRRTDDSGLTWQLQTLPDGLIPQSVRFQDADRGLVTAMDTGSRVTLLRTRDGGATWTARPTNLERGGYFNLQPAGEDIAYAIDRLADHPISTLDGGATWRLHRSGFPGRVESFLFTADGTGWAAGDDFIAKSVDGGTTWISSHDVLRRSMNLTALRFLDAREGWVAVDGTGLLKTGDGGRSWERRFDRSALWRALKLPDFPGFRAVWAVGSLTITGTALPGRGLLARSLDDGGTWKETLLDFDAVLADIDFPSPQTGYVLGHRAVTESLFVLKTTDRGDNWRIIPTPFRSRAIKIQFLDENTGFAAASMSEGDSAASIFRTLDGGLSWERAFRFPGFTLRGMQWLDERRGWFLTRDTLYRTEDGGRNWSKRAPSPTTDFSGIQFVDARNGWIYSRHGRVLATTDGGDTWREDSLGVGTLNAGHFLPDGTGFVAGANGAFHRFDPASISTDPTGGGESGAWEVGAPFRSGRLLVFTLHRAGRVRVRLVDAAGRAITQVADRRYGPGTHRMTLPTGIAPALVDFRILP
jgi:photosystem II stability/assembly factor-like uncharacterized protein